MKTNKVLLSIGSNIGDRKKNIQTALNLIDQKIGDVISISKVYQTPALGFIGDDFYNCCIAISTKLNPLELKIPHPHLQERAFVILPLLDIARSKIHPILKITIAELKDDLKDLNSIHQLDYVLKMPILNTMELFNNIVIEGNIGIGKTTLSKKLSKDLNKNLILEGFKENPFLDKFYQDPNRYALNLELTFLIDRCRQLNDYKNQMDLFKSGVVFDYDIFKSLIFAGVTLSEIDFNLFRSIFYSMTKDLFKSNLVIYLLQTTDKLLININKRGRNYEKDINKDYLDKISNAYLNYLNNRPELNVVFVDVSDLDFVEKDEDYLKLLFRIKQKLR